MANSEAEDKRTPQELLQECIETDRDESSFTADLDQLKARFKSRGVDLDQSVATIWQNVFGPEASTEAPVDTNKVVEFPRPKTQTDDPEGLRMAAAGGGSNSSSTRRKGVRSTIVDHEVGTLHTPKGPVTFFDFEGRVYTRLGWSPVNEELRLDGRPLMLKLASDGLDRNDRIFQVIGLDSDGIDLFCRLFKRAPTDHSID